MTTQRKVLNVGGNNKEIRIPQYYAGFEHLLLDIDLPFVDDGLRVYAKAEERRHFFDLCKAELDAHGVRYALVRGVGEARFAAALDAIQFALAD